MNVHQAADYLGVAEDTLYKHATKGTVPAFKLGSLWRFRKRDLDEWIDRQIDQQLEKTKSEAASQQPPP